MSAEFLHSDAIAVNDVDSTDRLVGDFQAYSAWRGQLSQKVSQLSRWLNEQDLEDAQTQMRIQSLLEKLKDDKLNIAFVAEFSRGKSELINAIFFAHYGQRVLPSSAGRTTMCPTEILYDASRPPSIQLLPIETRLQNVTTSEYRRYTDEWTTTLLDLDNAEAMLGAFRQVGQTKRVPTELAKQFGLYDENDPDQRIAVGADGLIEIPAWRHAIINFPHPLLEQGLVILDTPGLNAIGTEPELTLNLLPNAHAILFILAADTGVTKSDIDVWRNHIGKAQGGARGRLVVLNKIDGLWDDLKSGAEIEGEISRQVQTTAELLGVPTSHVYPISAQKALVAKVQHDDALLDRARLGALEAALSGELLPAKQDIVRDSTITEVDDIVLATRQILTARRTGLQEQLEELSRLRGKNQDVVVQMMDKVQADKRHFEQGLVRFQALRSIFSQQTNQLMSLLGMDALKAEIARIRDEMERTWFSFGEGGLRAVMERFFKDTNANIARSAEQVAEIQAMMAAMYKKFSEEHGLGQVTPPPFSTLKYHKEMARLEKSFREHFNTVSHLLTTGRNRITAKFFETVASRVVTVFEVANRDVENWLKAVMAPMETQVREHQLQLRRRLESIKRIHKATDTLEGRIEELEEMDTQLLEQLNELDARHRMVLAALNTEIVRMAA
ncbi:dynamin family protein [Amantichitinum ursilacus]|uniref:Bacterial dynamin-like protein n=1 Tax=Amantichitinum ursilacus TaxID=857265 RepID=A0A0N0XG12_9NEIS|nr:dynamin family protein [Amantichitinum ursilacus]KPC49343.1 Bacterial dynamin-like protein [Amantichitinum ursilacus]